MARYVMVIDSNKCMDCKACILACQQRNNVPYGISRNWVHETVVDSASCGFRFQPGACMHCDDPSCVRACPTGATWKGKDGAVEIDKSRCIGCGSCVEACPYHARFINPNTGTADKCDYCRASTPGETPALCGRLSRALPRLRRRRRSHFRGSQSPCQTQGRAHCPEGQRGQAHADLSR